MNGKSFLFSLTLLLTLAFPTEAQTAPSPTPAPPDSHRAMDGQHPDMEHDHAMAAMQQHHMAAMHADLQAMKASLEQMKVNVPAITDSTEKARWQANVDLWTKMIAHLDLMMMHMDAMGGTGMMGHGMMHHEGMGARPSPPPDDKKPE